MFATGKYLKDRAANARRAATTLRQLADSVDNSIADRGVMLAAAVVVDSIAAKTAKLGKERKASEEKFERDRQDAHTKIKPFIDALPATTTLDKIALACSIPHFSSHLLRALRDDKKPSDSMWSLNSWHQQAKGDIASSLAYAVATQKATVESAVDGLRIKLQESIANPETVRLAERFELAINPTLEAYQCAA